ncbi:hypothetical protein PSHT_13728 [Puccinia striiformis]|uniref:Phosphatidylserine decarboxylase n=1 Tax=Puccinia striiformis TaxID=27350 RepID=A0A2S4UNX4_9BASI|nr:hypothetical protein PSHT_13728 [Puccinia striiformis]
MAISISTNQPQTTMASSSSSPSPPSPTLTKISTLKGALNRVKSIPSSLKPSNLASRSKSKSPNRLSPTQKVPKPSSPVSDHFNHPNGLGLCSIEINRATGLPYWKAVTRLSFDMDPFVIISFGKKIFRTRVIRHCMDPVWDEKLFFHVQKSESAFSILFSMYDWDKMSSNDYIGESQLLLEDLMNDTEQNLRIDHQTGLYQLDQTGKLVGDQMTDYELPVVHTPSSSTKSSSPTTTEQTNGTEPSHQVTYNGKLSIKAKFIPYSAMRQVFWRKYLEEFDTDESGTISTTELTSMLDSLGSTLTRETIASFYSRHGKSSNQDQDTLSFEQVIGCLESELVKPLNQKLRIDSEDEQIGVGLPAASGGTAGQELTGDGENTPPSVDPPSSPSSPLVSISFIGHNSRDVTKSLSSRSGSLISSPSSPNLEEISEDDPNQTRPLMRHRSSSSYSGLQYEKVVNISCCPICHQEKQTHSSEQNELDMVTHMAVCASQDWSSLQNILSPGNFVTSSQANRKWFTKIIGKVQNGKYSLGANSANIIVQDRRTGKLIEEKMQAYVRLGIRLMYKSGHHNPNKESRRMEHQKIKNLLKSLTIKQGIKFNSPDSIKEIQPFINFHELDLNEIKLTLPDFKNFNEFFYRELKPNARPIEPADLQDSVFCSLADCRLMVFRDLIVSKSIWIKGRKFSLSKLLGNLGLRNMGPSASTTSPSSIVEEVRNEEENEINSNENSFNSTSTINDNDELSKWALGIFRLAPQDYHRFHSPIDGKIIDIEYIEGQYYTVNPMAIRSSIDVYGENVRVVVCIQTAKFEKVYCVFVGAMMVGSINMSIKVNDQVRKGQDVGYFAFGGSTILTIVESEKIKWDDDLLTNSNHSVETLVRVGNRVGVRKTTSTN